MYVAREQGKVVFLVKAIYSGKIILRNLLCLLLCKYWQTWSWFPVSLWQLLLTAEYFTDLSPEFVSSDSRSIQWISVKARFTLRKITQVRCKLTSTNVRFLKCKKSLSRVSAGLVWTIFQRLVQTNLSPVYVIHRRVNRAEIKLIVLWLLRHLFSVQVCFVQRNFWRIQSFRASKNYKLHNSRIFV
jgi:hypothetical protein